MNLLLKLASALNAVYRIALFTWLLYCLVIQFKHRREIAERRGFELHNNSQRRIRK